MRPYKWAQVLNIELDLPRLGTITTDVLLIERATNSKYFDSFFFFYNFSAPPPNEWNY